MNTIEQQNESHPEDINLLELLTIIIDYRWLIASITGLFALFSIIYALLATPIYQATAMVQIESKKSGIAGLEGMGELFNSNSQAVTEIEIMKSRWVIGKGVDNLHLNITAQAKRFPVIGNFLARRFTPTTEKPLASGPFKQYDWGGANIKVFQLKVPASLENKTLVLSAQNNNHYQLSHNDTVLLQGEVGKVAEGNGITLQIQSLIANPGTEFYITKRNRLATVLAFQKSLQAAEKGKLSGMIGLSLEHSNPDYAKQVLNEFAKLYVQQNVERMSAEAANSLEFLHKQLPEVRIAMEQSEAKLNQYQIGAKSADITIETQAVLDQMVKLDTSLSELKLKQIEMDKKFTASHPVYQTLMNQISSTEASKKALEEKVKNLPETQQELLRLQRDVKVSSEIYTQMLQKAQELDIARASTVGNARIIDEADIDTASPVAPKRSLIVLIATLLGGIISIIIAFVHNMLHRGIENPADIEALNLPVYANVPFSNLQIESESKNNGLMPLLTKDYPTDAAIEALRSLHASLHFALLEADNNIIMISGPSPSVGKSFISANLAAIMAQSGKKILLIDGDMRKGHLHKFFGQSNTENGLSTLLGKTSSLEQSLSPTSINGLDIIPRGKIPPNPSELLLGKYFNELITNLSPQYDIVIIDTPPILAVADALAVSKIAGASFIVARFGENPIGEIKATIKRFENNGIQLKGAILNATRKKLSNSYSYQKYNYGYKYYQYEYKSDKD